MNPLAIPFLRLIVLSGGILVLGCQTIVVEPVIAEQPQRLIASREAYFGPSYHIIMNGRNSLIYTHNPDGFSGNRRAKKIELQVSNERWIEFRQDLDQARVWDWEKNYDDPDVVDGGGWTLDIEYSDQSLDARGENAFPDEGYEAFIAAVRKLIGGKEF